jgi:hypothetical protein
MWRQWKFQKFSCVQLEDLPDEVLLEIFKFLKRREILNFGQVSTRIRAISNNESLWRKLNLFNGNVPYGFIEKAVQNGCRYLSLAHAVSNAVPDMPTLLLRNGKKVPRTTQIHCNLKYLNIEAFGHHEELLKNCHSLEKLSVERLSLSYEDVKHIIQNGKTLKVLDFGSGGLDPVTGPTLIQNLFKKCAELSELNFSLDFSYAGYAGRRIWFTGNAFECKRFENYQERELLSAIVNNLTPKILKVDLSYNRNLEDNHVMALVKRCSKITELKLRGTSITNNSVDSIAKHLDSSLEKLDVCKTEIDSTALLQLGTVRNLKILNFLKEEEIDSDTSESNYTPLDTMEMKNLRKKLPEISINKEYMIIATPNVISNPEDGLWEIKAKQEKLFNRYQKN